MSTSSAGGQGRSGPTPGRRRWPRRLFVGAAAVLAGAALLGFVVAPVVGRRVAERELGAWLGRRVTIGRLRVNPFALSVTIDDLRVFEADGRTRFVEAARLFADVQAASLLRRALVVRELRVESPRVRLVRARAAADPLAGFNFADLARRLRAPPGRAGPGGPPRGPRLVLEGVRVLDGEVRYEDRVTGSRHALTDLDARLPALSAPSAAAVELTARFRLDGAAVVVRGRVTPRPGPRRASAIVRVSGLALGRFRADVPLELPVALDPGTLTGNADLTLGEGRRGAWTLAAKGRLALAGVALGGAGAPRVPIDALGLVVRRASLDWGGGQAARASADVGLDVGPRGRGDVAGTVGFAPLATDLRFRVEGVDLGLWARHVARGGRARLTAGVLSGRGRLALSGPSLAHVGLEAEIEAKHVAAIDVRDQEPLVAWRSMRVAGLAISTPPLRLSARQLAFDGLAVRIVHRADRSWSLGAVPAARARLESPRRARPERTIDIGEVTVSGGRFGIDDRAIEPHFAGVVDDISARVSGLSSRNGSRARVELSGTPAGAGALAIGGTINALAGKVSADLEGSVKRFGIARLSPYAAKYTGYLLDSGDLDLMTSCHLAEGVLQAKNRLVIQGAKLGARVESARATRLPLPLVVRVLSTRRNVIELDVPVNGSFDDPSFHLGRAIGKALRNVVVKTVASPFTILGAIFGRGGDEDLSHVDFRPRVATLDASAEAKLRELGRALAERNELSFEIEGSADPERDRGFEGGDLSALAARRASAVRDALARAAPAGAGRLIVGAPRVGKDTGSRVQLRIKED
jgi:hypothetical protein